jgi:hypothetical protein
VPASCGLVVKGGLPGMLASCGMSQMILTLPGRVRALSPGRARSLSPGRTQIVTTIAGLPATSPAWPAS